MKRRDGRATGQAGEYFVAAEICRRGGTATTFAGNMPGFDIVAGDGAGNRQVQISVKTKNTERFWTTDGVRDAEARPDGEVDRFWVFVDLSGGRPPEYYVVPDNDIRDSIRRMHGEYQERYEARHGHRRDSSIHGVRVKDIAEFRDRWDMLGLELSDLSVRGALRLPEKTLASIPAERRRRTSSAGGIGAARSTVM